MKIASSAWTIRPESTAEPSGECVQNFPRFLCRKHSEKVEVAELQERRSRKTETIAEAAAAVSHMSSLRLRLRRWRWECESCPQFSLSGKTTWAHELTPWIFFGPLGEREGNPAAPREESLTPNGTTRKEGSFFAGWNPSSMVWALLANIIQ